MTPYLDQFKRNTMTRFQMSNKISSQRSPEGYAEWIKQVSFHNDLVEQGIEVIGLTIDTSSFSLPEDHPLMDKARELATVA